jgi:protein involved in polysaccharide export with SLBB domain
MYLAATGTRMPKRWESKSRMPIKPYLVAACTLVISLTAPLDAWPQAETPPSSMTKSLEDLPATQVADADRIVLKVQDQPELTGEYHVSQDGTLSVPVIGRISIIDLTLVQLEQTLTRRISEVTGRPTYVTVEVVAFRPIFVTGLVSKPGALEWQPGLTVLQAEALAGGIYRAPEPASNMGGFTRVEAVRSLRKARAQQAQLIATQARLKAEIADADHVELPAALVELVGDEEAKALIAVQQSLLDGRRAALQKQLEAIENSSSLAANELDGLEEQSNRVDQQLLKRREMHAKIATLLEKGLVPRERTMEEDIKVAELEERATNVAVARARVQGTVAALKQNAVALRESRRASLEAELADTRNQLAQTEIDVEAAMETYGKLIATGMQTETASRSRVVIEYTIVRRSASGEERGSAQTSSYLQPGDVLSISQRIENTTSGQVESLNDRGDEQQSGVKQ